MSDRLVVVPLVLLLLTWEVACGSIVAPEDVKLGREFALRARRDLEFVRDPTVHEFVTKMGRGLVVAAGPQPFPYRFYVLADDKRDAFSVPGGYVYVTSGTLLAIRHSSELAAILAHEIGHIVERHGIEDIDRLMQQVFRMALADARRAALYPGTPHPGHDVAGAVRILAQFDHDQELEADAFAVRTLRVAGYCPGAMTRALTLFVKPLGLERVDGAQVFERIDALTAMDLEDCDSSENLETDRLPEMQQRISRWLSQRSP